MASEEQEEGSSSPSADPESFNIEALRNPGGASVRIFFKNDCLDILIPVSNFCEVQILELHEGECLSQEQYAELQRCARASEAYLRGLALLEHSDQSRGMLQEKLIRRGCNRDAARLALDVLTQKGLVDDFRFACTYGAQRLKKRIGREGPATLRLRFLSKHLERSIIDQAIVAIFDGATQEEAIKAAWDFSASRGASDPAQVKNYLRSLGFSWLSIQSFCEAQEE